MNKIFLISVFSILTLNVMAQEKIVQTAGRDQLGTFAPKFAELNDDVLFRSEEHTSELQSPLIISYAVHLTAGDGFAAKGFVPVADEAGQRCV